LDNSLIQIASDRAFLLILISVCLGACFVWAFWEIEEARKRRQQHRELVRDARRLVKSGH
jgi:cbb3-type cytochrome oxidase subunit 3